MSFLRNSDFSIDNQFYKYVVRAEFFDEFFKCLTESETESPIDKDI